ncbi:unnamed protein product [Boreogadus saida]
MSRLTPALVLAQVHCPTLTKHRETHHKRTDAGSTMCCVHMMDCHSKERCVTVEWGDKRKTLGTSILIRKADCQLVRKVEDALGLKKRQDWDSAVPMFQNP